jgi:hypothetical protein
MKAVLALVVIYVGAFLVAIQGGSPDAVQAAGQDGKPAQNAIDPAKESEIRSLVELAGTRDQIQDGIDASTEQYKEKLLAAIPNNQRGQAFVTAFSDSYQKRIDVDALSEAMVRLYDKHFTAEEIKALLEFYGSPAGQKFAAEMPKLMREFQAESRSQGARAAKQTIDGLKEQNRELGQSARLALAQRRGPAHEVQAAPQP